MLPNRTVRNTECPQTSDNKMCSICKEICKGIKAFYRNATACVRVEGELSESFDVEVGVRQGCVMSPWLFNIFMDGCMREMKARV